METVEPLKSSHAWVTQGDVSLCSKLTNLGFVELVGEENSKDSSHFTVFRDNMAYVVMISYNKICDLKTFTNISARTYSLSTSRFIPK